MGFCTLAPGKTRFTDPIGMVGVDVTLDKSEKSLVGIGIELGHCSPKTVTIARLQGLIITISYRILVPNEEREQGRSQCRAGLLHTEEMSIGNPEILRCHHFGNCLRFRYRVSEVYGKDVKGN